MIHIFSRQRNIRCRSRISASFLACICAAWAAVAHARAEVPVEMIGQWGGPVFGVAVQSDLVCCAAGPRVLILDVGNSSSPILLGQSPVLPAMVQGVAISGQLVCAALGWNGLQVIDISSPQSPSCRGLVVTTRPVTAVAVCGRYAYFTEEISGLPGSGGLVVLDLINPDAPVEVGRNDAGPARAIAVSGTYAYVAGGGAGLSIFSVAAPTSPTRVGGYAYPSKAKGVAVAGQYAYVTDYDGALYTLDVSNPASPQYKSSLSLPQYCQGVAVSANKAYVANWSGGMKIIDVSNPTAPVQVGAYDTTLDGSVLALAVSANRAYVGIRDKALDVVDVTNPASPARLARHICGGYPAVQLVSNNYLFSTGCGDEGFVLDITRPREFTHIANYPVMCPEGGARSGNHLYYASSTGQLQIVDIANPASPVASGSCDLGVAEAARVAVQPPYAYVTAFGSGLKIVNVSDPSAPSVVGSYSPPGNALGIAVSGSYAYLGGGPKAAYGPRTGLEVIDVSNPGSPVRVGSCADVTDAREMVLSSNYAYVADGSSGLQIVDISNPSAPVRVGNYPTSRVTMAAALWHGYVCIATTSEGIHVIDVSNPAAPARVGGCNTPGLTWDLAVSGNRAYVGDQTGGVVVLQLGTPAIWSDFDVDGDVDLNDLDLFIDCAAGPAIPHNGTDVCISADLDSDNDVDQSDFGIFQVSFGN